jgi:chaperonin GroES
MTAWSSPRRRRRKDQGRDHHPRHRQGKAAGRRIVAVGPARATKRASWFLLDVKAGDRVLFGKWSGTEVKLDGEDLLIMKESDIMGIIEAEQPPKKKVAFERPIPLKPTFRKRRSQNGC